MPSSFPFEIPVDPFASPLDDPTAGPHKPGGGGDGPYNPALGSFGSFGQGGFGFDQGYNPFLGSAGLQQRRRMGLASAPAAQYASLAPQASIASPTSAPSGGAPAPSPPSYFTGNPWMPIDRSKLGAAAQKQTPANDVDMILAGLGQGQWSWAGDPAARAQLAAQAYAHAKDMEQSSLLGTQIDTQDPWLRAFSRTQGRLQGQRQAADTLRNYDTEQIDYIKNLAEQLFMAKLGQYYQQQNKPKQGGIGNVLGDILGIGAGSFLGGFGKAAGTTLGGG